MGSPTLLANSLPTELPGKARQIQTGYNYFQNKPLIWRRNIEASQNGHGLKIITMFTKLSSGHTKGSPEV